MDGSSDFEGEFGHDDSLKDIRESGDESISFRSQVEVERDEDGNTLVDESGRPKVS